MGEVSAEAVRGWLRELCAHPDRHVGGEGNRAAAELFEQVARDAGFTVETTELECVEWRRGESMLHLAGEALPLKTGPYSLQYRGSAPLAEASTLEQLAAGSFAGTILLLHGDLVRGQLMPKR
jgi:hypothetical protein